MTRLVINTGTGANTGTGESLFSAMTKINDNFDELYTAFFGSDSAVSAITATSITARDTNGSITIGVNGSGEVILDGTVIIDQEIKSSGSAGVTIGDDLNLKGSLRFGSDQGAINSVLDEDTMASDSATALATQQSIKAYVDTELGLASTLRIVNDDSSATNINITQQTLKLKNGRDIEISMATDDITFTLSENIAVNSLESIDSSGIEINDNLTVGGNIILGDSQQLQLGDSGDLKVFHNGSHSIVRETGTGNLFLQSDNNVILSKDTGTETMVKGIADGAVELYHDNTKTFETTATGVIVGAADTNAEITTQGTGDLTLSTNSGTNSGTIKIADGSNGDITIENDGTGDILLKAGGQVGIGSVSSPDTSLHIKTAAAKVTLQRTADGNTPGISFQQSGGNVRAEFMMDGTSGTSNTLFFKTHDGSSLAERFRVTHTGVKVSGTLEVDNIAGADSSAIQINNLDTNVISSSASSEIIINEAVRVSGALDVGGAATIAGNLTSTSTIEFGSLTDGAITITAFVDEDGMDSNSASLLPTQQSVKAYVDSRTITVSGDDSASLELTLDSGNLNLSGGNNITTSTNSAGTVTFDLDDAISVSTSITVPTIVTNDISSSDSTSVVINDALDVAGGLFTSEITALDSTAIQFNNATNFNGNVQINATLTTTGDITSGGSIVIGSAQMSEADLEQLDDLTAGTVTASKAVVVDSDKDISGFRNVTATGSFIIGSADMNETDLEKLDGITNGTVAANKAIVADGNKDISGLRNVVMDGNIEVGGNLTVSGTTTSVNTTNLEIADALLELNKNNSGGADVDAGLLIQRGSAGNNAAFYWNEGDDVFKAVLTNSSASATAVTDSSFATIRQGGLVFGSESVVVTSIKDEDDMTSNSATALATQQSIKAFVDAEIASVTGGSNTLSVVGDDSATFEFALSSGVLQLSGGTNISTSTSSSNIVTFDLDADITIDSFTIGSAAINETDITKIDAITNGTVAANKAVVVDADKDAGTFRNVTASGSFIIGSADMNETDLEKLDGITNGTAAANKALVVDGSKDIGTLGTITAATGDFQTIKVNTISSDDSTSLLIADGLTIGGPVRSDGSGAVVFEEGINVSDHVQVNSTLNATGDITSGGSFIIGAASMNETDLEKLDGITNGTAAANKAVVLDASKDIGTLGAVTATSFVIGSADINESDLEQIDGLTAGTVTASKAVVVDSDKDIASFRNVTATGSFIIGSADMNETDLEKLDGITNGTAAANKALVVDGSKDIGTLGTITAATGDFQTIKVNTISSDDSTSLLIADGLTIGGPVRSDGSDAVVFEEGINLQGHLQVNSTADITGAVTSGAITSSGVVTATGFTIGNAVINESELETIDTITAGTVAASKAVVVDSDKDISGFRNVTATGSFIIGSADMNETDLEKLDGITNGTVAANKAVVVDASKDIGSFGTITGQTLDITTIQSTDSSAVTINDGMIINGAFGFNAGVNVDTILDEDDMSSNDADALATQQSIKAYVDAEVGGLSSTLSVVAEDSATFELTVGTDVLQFSGTDDINITTSSTKNISIALDNDITVDTITLGSAAINETDITKIDGITNGTAAANKAVVLDGSKDIGTLGAVTATSFVIGSADINESDLEQIDGLTAGTVAASKAVVVDSDKDASGFRNVTATGAITAGSFVGPLTGTASQATVADTVKTVSAGGTDASFFIPFVDTQDSSSTAQTLVIDGGLSYNPSTNILDTTATAAQYADLAERFEADAEYEMGTVMVIGGNKEITQSTTAGSTDVVGIISSTEQAAFTMNAGVGDDATHPLLALAGRVKVKVIGRARKGDRLVTSAIPGCAERADIANCTTFNVVGRALEDKDDLKAGLINCLTMARL